MESRKMLKIPMGSGLHVCRQAEGMAICLNQAAKDPETFETAAWRTRSGTNETNNQHEQMDVFRIQTL
jgi:hypothetical protein